MNISMIKYIIGYILKLEAGFLIFPLLVSFYFKENASMYKSYFYTITILLFIGFTFSRKLPKNQKMFAKEGLVTVSLSWIFLSFFGALPFVFSNYIPSLIDAFFETVSGFTTTGASILTNVEALPNSLLFWRSFTHLVGGMGVLVLALAILPKSNNRSLHLMKAEVPGPTFGKLVAKMSYNSRILYIIYILMTILLAIILMLEGMPFFDSMLHAFGTAGTGGFGIKNTSIAYYNNSLIHYTIGIGMLLFSLNFNLYYILILGNIKQFFKSEEMKWFFSIVFLSILLICLNIHSIYDNVFNMIRDVFFTVASIVSTTGYSTADFDRWPLFSKTILLFLMFMGGCAGSTAGGLKVSRVVILIKNTLKEFKKLGSSNKVVSLKIEGKPITNDLMESISSYLIVYISVFIIILVGISFSLPNLNTSFSAVAATFNNIGPGFESLGPTQNYSALTDLNKIILSFSMLLGRLEIFPVLILFSPEIYKNWNKKYKKRK
ncbi:TrkH family potassium uptake protein [Fusobacterium sp.]|uniref:TrkH family potassium uptake protein n=1 Tax=Fusobacterium sp. TaxID=68766 RepID=UPI002627B5D5|nr:TrkH family potassium uptake protein [Fusobacterium sp.]